MFIKIYTTKKIKNLNQDFKFKTLNVQILPITLCLIIAQSQLKVFKFDFFGFFIQIE